MEINRSNVMEIIQKADLKPDKDYGQNFLVEPEISKRIVDSLFVEENEKVLEIGPGIGSLTHFLSLSRGIITAVDIDARMADWNKLIYKDSNVTVIENDIRKENITVFDKIIANLPYNITTEAVTYLLLNATSCKRMVLMCQAETFAHFHDVCGKEYGPVSILIHLLGSSKSLFNVKAGCFQPVPKCASTVFSIDLDNHVSRESAIGTYKLSKNLFINRRKTILNNLVNYLKDKDKANSLLNALSIPLNKRPEELSPDTYLSLYNAIFDEKEVK